MVSGWESPYLWLGVEALPGLCAVLAWSVASVLWGRTYDGEVLRLIGGERHLGCVIFVRWMLDG